MSHLYWLYIYYKAPEREENDWRQASLSVVKQVFERLGFHGKVLRRPDVSQGQMTWMEVYGPLEHQQIVLLTEDLTTIRRCEVQTAASSANPWQAVQLHQEIFIEQTPTL